MNDLTNMTSVCSGSLLLAAAGLLRGYRSTSHWAALEPGPSLQRGHAGCCGP
ncbi:hypothetical protein [Corallococcus terminator]|uniref:hypothetical protein n=1 Tax=Corallococcus terminator TaxID=2316733 RepID=UPI001FC9EB4D|nr:hypothetical protein [Corallococcus terminator]